MPKLATKNYAPMIQASAMNEDPEIEYEAAPTVVELDGNEAQADAATLAGAWALLCLYTSKPYLAEAGALLGRFADAFEHWPEATQRLGTHTLAEWTTALREQRAAFDRGLALLDAGYTAAAYAAIAAAVIDGLEPRDPRDERHVSLRFIAEEIGPSLAGIAERLGAMAARIDTTLTARWAYQTLLADPSPSNADPLPMSDPLDIDTGNLVPKTGLWLPTSVRYGCPNFLVAGQAAPPLTRAATRYDYEATDSGGGEPAKPAWSAYDYVEEPTTWRMMWYDTRYRAGISTE